MDNINIDVISNYNCNSSCKYCFLYKLKHEDQVINTIKLDKQFKLVSSKYNINSINIYGGEVSLLNRRYLKKLIDLCSKYAQVNVVTNFTNMECNEFLANENVTVSTSINDERSHNDEVEHSLLFNENKNLSLLQVVTPSLLNKSSIDILNHLELFKRSVSFLQYSPARNAKINFDISNNDYSCFIKRIINVYMQGNYSFDITNIGQLDDVVNGNYDPRMRSILFINPFNEYMSISYENGLEYFKIHKTLVDWEYECSIEEVEYKKRCGNCEYYGRCYAEHIKEWRDNDECCGMKSLIQWYEKNIYQNNRNMSIEV